MRYFRKKNLETPCGLPRINDVTQNSGWPAAHTRCPPVRAFNFNFTIPRWDYRHPIRILVDALTISISIDLSWILHNNRAGDICIHAYTRMSNHGHTWSNSQRVLLLFSLILHQKYFWKFLNLILIDLLKELRYLVYNGKSSIGKSDE